MLQKVEASKEQLPFISDTKAGVMVVRGAAGSGKTTTAILRLRSLLRAFINRRERFEDPEPVRALVLTYNKTLSGYIADLVEQQRRDVDNPDAVDLEISTFGKWSHRRLDRPLLVEKEEGEPIIKRFGRKVELPPDFLVEEVDYVLGRYLPDDLEQYLTTKRVGRGDTPRVDGRREAILNVILNYNGWKAAQGLSDFNDLAVQLALNQVEPLYDIIIGDECQDFSGNQLRAMYNHLKEDHSLTIIIDSAQRIYSRGFTWKELGIPVRGDNTKTLKINFRNTQEIAALAQPLVAGLKHDEDATLPDFTKTTRSGKRPVVLSGRFSKQTEWVVQYIRRNVNLKKETVAFLHPKGGNWFRFIRERLAAAHLPFVELTGVRDWPEGDENIGLVTCHSGKGLEFDHVILLGLNEECLPVLGENADREEKLRRLIAMSIGRAREFVCIGYRPDDKAGVLDDLDEDTYDLVEL